MGPLLDNENQPAEFSAHPAAKDKKRKIGGRREELTTDQDEHAGQNGEHIHDQSRAREGKVRNRDQAGGDQPNAQDNHAESSA
jgi:hypothetical protein